MTINKTRESDFDSSRRGKRRLVHSKRRLCLLFKYFGFMFNSEQHEAKINVNDTHRKYTIVTASCFFQLKEKKRQIVSTFYPTSTSEHIWDYVAHIYCASELILWMNY